MMNNSPSSCPRLSRGTNSSLLSNNYPAEWWGPGTTYISREPCMILSSRSISLNKLKFKKKLSGFFQAQLLKPRLKKLRKSNYSKQNKLISVRNQISRKIINSFDNHSEIHDLPEELLVQILITLPVKYILRCRSVNKSWYSLIQTPMFATLQLNYQKNIIDQHNHPKYLLFKNAYMQDLTKAFSVRLDDVHCQEYCPIKFLPGLPNYAWYAQSYGLVCVSKQFNIGDKYYIRGIYLWNPLIQKYKTLPMSPIPFKQNGHPLAWEALAFGFVPQVNDYVVVHITKPCLHPNPNSVIIAVYSLNTNSWKKFRQDNVFIDKFWGSTSTSRDKNVVFVNGAAFWLMVSDRRKILMCFDTKTHILREISLPDWVAYQPALVPIIHQFGQSIAYFVWERNLNHFDMWVLKDDSINEFTWEKKMCASPSKDVQKEVLGIRNNGEPILEKSNDLITCNLNNHEANDFVDSWDRWTPGSPYIKWHAPHYVVSPFVETLVLL